jgi:hypothetical protein
MNYKNSEGDPETETISRVLFAGLTCQLDWSEAATKFGITACSTFDPLLASRNAKVNVAWPRTVVK